MPDRGVGEAAAGMDRQDLVPSPVPARSLYLQLRPERADRPRSLPYLPRAAQRMDRLRGGGASHLAPQAASHRAVPVGGARSYSLYLWHYPVWFFLAPYDFWYPAKLLTMCAATVGAAEASYRFVEQPFQRFGRKKLEVWRGLSGGASPRASAPGAALDPLSSVRQDP